MKLQRIIDNNLKNHLKNNREAIVLLGARQTGKTTLLKRLFPSSFYLLVDNEPVRRNLETYDINSYKQFMPDRGIVIIDEIHLLSDPGRCAKIIYDQIPKVQLIITGSSSLNIKNKASESMAGRKIDYSLFPLTFSEYLVQNQIETSFNHNIFTQIGSKKPAKRSIFTFDLKATLSNILTYGLYPAVTGHYQKEKYLMNLADSVILKDLIDLRLIDDRRAALNTLKLIAFQIGQLVNFSEIAQRVNKDIRTIKKYLEIFKQSFIIFELSPFSRNKRDEIGKSPKIYFWDVGLRNALIENFTDINLRPDRGQLFENFIISEFAKSNYYLGADFKINYWRTKQGSEVDLVISKNQSIIGAEIKYSPARISRAFTNRYEKAEIRIISPENFY